MYEMLQILEEIEKQMSRILIGIIDETIPIKTLYIDYHKPFVKRIWFSVADYRVYLHLIEAMDRNVPTQALFHPHPWPSAMRIIKGEYLMGVGNSKTDDAPEPDCTLIIPAGTCYEMTNHDGWHYVYPTVDTYTIMVTGPPTGRKMPIEPQKTFRELTPDEVEDILSVVLNYYAK